MHAFNMLLVNKSNTKINHIWVAQDIQNDQAKLILLKKCAFIYSLKLEGKANVRKTIFCIIQKLKYSSEIYRYILIQWNHYSNIS